MSRPAIVRKTKWVNKTDDKPGHNVFVDIECTLLEFGTYYVELEKGVGQTSAAICLMPNGSVEWVDLYQLILKPE